jgi:VanZ family protein
MRVRVQTLGWTAVVLTPVAALLLVPLPPSWDGPWQSKLFDLGHVALFFALTLALWVVLKRSWAWAIGVALALGGLAELVQDWFGRTGSLLDFVRDVLGSACALVVVRAGQGPLTLPRLAGHVFVLVALLAWPVADAAPRLLDAWEGYRELPTLADFATERQLLRWEWNQANLERVPDPQEPSGWSARLQLLPGPRLYPAAGLEPICRDWRGYHRVCCSFTVTERPLVVVISVRGQAAAGGSPHYQFEDEYPPGRHVVCADLATVARAAKPRPVDLAQVCYFQVFIYRPKSPRTIYLHRVWLE